MLVVGHLFGQVDSTKIYQNEYNFFIETSGSTIFQVFNYEIINDEIKITKDGMNWESYPIVQIKRITDNNQQTIWENKKKRTWSMSIFSVDIFSVTKYFQLKNNKIYLSAGIPFCSIGLKKKIYDFNLKSSMYIGTNFRFGNPIIVNNYHIIYNKILKESYDGRFIDEEDFLKKFNFNIYITSLFLSYETKVNNFLFTLGLEPSYYDGSGYRSYLKEYYPNHKSLKKYKTFTSFKLFPQINIQYFFN